MVFAEVRVSVRLRPSGEGWLLQHLNLSKQSEVPEGILTALVCACRDCAVWCLLCVLLGPGCVSPHLVSPCRPASWLNNGHPTSKRSAWGTSNCGDGEDLDGADGGSFDGPYLRLEAWWEESGSCRRG